MPIIPNTSQKNHKVRILSCLILVFLVGTGGFIWYRHDQNNKAIAVERGQYAQAERELDDISEKSIAKLGQPDDQKKIKECGYTSDTFELAPQGDLFCKVANYVIYRAENQEQASTFKAELETIINMDSNHNETRYGDSINTPSSIKLGTYDFKISKLNCFRSYKYVSRDELAGDAGLPKLQLNYSQGLLVQNECSSFSPLKAYFPLKNS
jgi:hypothetical protein